MAQAAIYPAALAAIANFFGEYLGTTSTELTLNADITSGALTFVVNESIPASWPQACIVTIENEQIRCDSYNAGTKTFTVNAAGRGYQGSTASAIAAAHTAGNVVGLYINHTLLNQLIAELVAVEATLGLGGFSPQTDWHEYVHEGWITPAESTVTGTATCAGAQARNIQQMTTGATSGSASQMRTLIMDTVASNITLNKTRRLSLAFNIVQVDANTDFKAYLTDENVTTSPSNTARHIGVRTNGATVLISTADGTTEQTTDITANITANVTAVVNFTFDGTTVRAYVNGVLRATHAANVPIAGGTSLPCERWWLANTAAANKIAYMNRFYARFAT